MPRTKRAATVGLAILLAGCAASNAGESPSAAPAASAACVGRNAQDIEVPQPARGFGLAWNETDDDARLAILEEIWADKGTHVQPDFDDRVIGRAAMDEHMDVFQTNRRGEYFEWRDWDPSNLHHDRVLMPWRLCAADGTTLLEGTDFGLIGPDGRLVETTGFYPAE